MELDVGGICCRGLICTRSSAQTIHRGLRRMLTYLFAAVVSYAKGDMHGLAARRSGSEPALPRLKCSPRPGRCLI
jgi:hypothetical protein